MKELSLNLLDIVQNSVKAQAHTIQIEIEEAAGKDRLTLKIEDDGCGMEKSFLEKVCDPFVTTRTTRKVGLGLSLLKESANTCGGSFTITSAPGQGTTVCASFQISHLDRMPLGDLPSTITAIIGAKDDIRYIYRHITDQGEFTMDTDELHQILGADIPLSEPEILSWIGAYVRENLDQIKGGYI